VPIMAQAQMSGLAPGDVTDVHVMSNSKIISIDR
jgi:hypothetical protein